MSTKTKTKAVKKEKKNPSAGLLVVGSVAFDSVKTPSGQRDEILGGSATYFSTAASLFTQVSLVAIVGEDFPEEHVTFLKSRKINVEGLERVKGKTFRWKGEYGEQLNEAKTLDTQLNVFQTFKPKLPASYQKHEIIFLANIDPDLQRDVLDQIHAPKLVACDTMNFWIQGKKDSLKKTLKKVDLLIINDSEAKQLSGEVNIFKAAGKIMKMGPKRLIIKRGEFGVLLFTEEGLFALPAFPLDLVIDPTGAGDTFAGGFMGYLAKTQDFTPDNLKRAVVYGSVTASYNVEDFSLGRLKTVQYQELEHRYRQFQKLIAF